MSPARAESHRADELLEEPRENLRDGFPVVAPEEVVLPPDVRYAGPAKPKGISEM